MQPDVAIKWRLQSKTKDSLADQSSGRFARTITSVNDCSAALPHCTTCLKTS